MMILMSATYASAHEITVLKSYDIKPYTMIIKGFKRECDSSLSEITLPESGSLPLNVMTKGHPDLIFAVGQRALDKAVTLDDNVPIVYSMVLAPQSTAPEYGRISGVTMNIASAEQLKVLLKVLPAIKKIGVIYDPGKSSQLFNEARVAAVPFGVSIVPAVVHSPGEAPSAFDAMIGGIDAFWLLPDTTIVTRETINHLLLRSFENKLPILAFSEKYAELGFLISLSIDEEDIGMQACELARRLLKNEAPPPMAAPRKIHKSINMNTARKFGIHLDPAVLKGFDLVE